MFILKKAASNIMMKSTHNLKEYKPVYDYITQCHNSRLNSKMSYQQKVRNQSRNILNANIFNVKKFMHQHKRRIMVGLWFVGFYSLICKKTINNQSQSIRLAVAGSLANMLCEVTFHFIDTLNVREKVNDQLLHSSFKNCS